VVGVAFAAVVTALVKDLITPLISIPGKTNFSNLAVKVDGGIFHYGDFLNALISFILVATAVFFVVVVPMNALMARRRTQTQVEEPTRQCPECLSSIPAAARRCAFCTAEVTPIAGAAAATT